MELTRSLLVCFYHICSISTIFLFLDLSYQIPTPTLLYDIWYHIFAHCFHKLGQFPFSISCHLTSLSFCKTLFVKPELISPWLGAKFMSKTSHHIISFINFCEGLFYRYCLKMSKMFNFVPILFASCSNEFFANCLTGNLFCKSLIQITGFANIHHRSTIFGSFC